MGEIFSLIVWVVFHLPQILSIVKAIIDFIRGIKDPALHAQAMTEFKSALQTAQASGEIAALEDFLKKWGQKV